MKSQDQSKVISEWMAQQYAAAARQYRLSDELHVTGAHHRSVQELLRRECERFNHPISVLDLGCGTGRHFHCFRNVKHLVGVDLSPEMLKEAENPVRAAEVQVQKVELICSDFDSISFPDGSFDLVVCLGVFGNGCSLTSDLMTRVHRWLTPQGSFLVDTYDLRYLPPLPRFKKFLRSKLHTVLPSALQNAWIKLSGWPPCYYCTFIDLWELAKTAGFSGSSLESVRFDTDAGPVAKFRLTARKAE